MGIGLEKLGACPLVALFVGFLLMTLYLIGLVLVRRTFAQVEVNKMEVNNVVEVGLDQARVAVEMLACGLLYKDLAVDTLELLVLD